MNPEHNWLSRVSASRLEDQQDPTARPLALQRAVAPTSKDTIEVMRKSANVRPGMLGAQSANPLFVPGASNRAHAARLATIPALQRSAGNGSVSHMLANERALTSPEPVEQPSPGDGLADERRVTATRPHEGWLSPARIAALQRSAGNQAVVRVLARLEQRPSGVWSNSRHYVTGTTADKSELGMADEVGAPDLTGADWIPTGKRTIYNARARAPVSVPTYKLKWQDDGGNVTIPQDCLTVAELVAAWLMQQDPEVIGEVKAVPTIALAGADTALGPGDILYHVHSEGDGDYHGAAVIAQDDGDVITVESDLTEGDEIVTTVPMFDMYAGHAGFHEDQLEDGDSGQTYVIRFGADGARSKTQDTMWSNLKKLLYNKNAAAKGRPGPALDAATRIMDAIQGALDADDSDYLHNNETSNASEEMSDASDDDDDEMSVD